MRACLVDDHYLAMGDSHAIKYVIRFAILVVQVFGPDYLRAPPQCSWHSDAFGDEKNVSFHVCPSQLIACTRGRRILMQHGTPSSEGTRRILHHFWSHGWSWDMDMGCIYWDMLFLQRHQYYPMVTSLYKILHRRGFPYGKVVKKNFSLQSEPMVIQHRWSFKQTATPITWATTL
jgi:uncharacterized C2H2 Zn-finger protein